MGNGNIGVGNESATRKPGQENRAQMAGAMSQQGTYVMGDNECAQQKLVRLVGCRDSRARPGVTPRVKQFGQTDS